MDAIAAGKPAEILDGSRVRLRLLRRDDQPRMLEILREPDVARWWAPRGAEAAANELFDDDAIGYAIEFDGRVIGAILCYEENEPDYRHAGIDVFIETEHQGRGLGPEAISILARYLFGPRRHHRLTIDPAAANERAIKAYERIGFKRVGVMRAYERGSDGSWHDGLLMDLLAGEGEFS